MAKSNSGKWVSRVGSAGGGKAYKKARPVNYYGALAVIIIAGLLVTMYSRYEYEHPGSAASSTPPAVGTTWYAGMAVDNCGQYEPNLTSDAKSPHGLLMLADNVLQIAPTSVADAGNNATLNQFALEYPGMTLTSSSIVIPNAVGVANPKETFKNGQTCATGTPDAGQKASVEYAYWSSFGQSKPTIVTDPSKIKLTLDERITLAFLPAGKTPLAPNQATVTAMVKAASSVTTTTTTAAGAVTTTIPMTTTTTAATTTTSKSTTTTKG